jgi:hypothetical protein
MKKAIPVIVLVIALGIGGFLIFNKNKNPESTITPASTPDPVAQQLPPDKQPSVSLAFDAVGHYVTVTVANLNADQIEYSLVYDAVVKNNKINTGASGGGRITGQTTYTQKQLLGSESSGHFTYHENIQNALMNLTLRDSSNRSVFSATYPFTVTPGKSVSLTASQ